MTSSYVYADAQVLCQRYHDPVDPNFYDASYYVHDRLGSVRLVVVPEYDQQQQTWAVRAANSYTYTPFGSFYDGQCIENIANPFKFTGQWHDVEIDQYHLRARQYDPTMMRFTSRDPVIGERTEPLTLHQYLYCLNNPVNMVDIDGKSAWSIFGALAAGTAVRGAATYAVAVGIDTNDDFLYNLGLDMHHLIAPAMFVGAIVGPHLPSVGQMGFKGAMTLWQATADAVGVTYLAGKAAAQGLSCWAMAHPFEVLSMMDVISQYGGPPGGVPLTPAGFVAWIHANSSD